MGEEKDRCHIVKRDLLQGKGSPGAVAKTQSRKAILFLGERRPLEWKGSERLGQLWWECMV